MPRQDHLCRAAATTGTETPNECFGSMRRLTVFVITTVAASAISMAGFQLLSVSGARAAKPDASEELSQGVAQLPATAPHQAWASPPRRSGADKVATQPTKLVTAPLASAKTPAPVHPAFTAVPHSIVVNRAGFPGGHLVWVRLPRLAPRFVHSSALPLRREARCRSVRAADGD